MARTINELSKKKLGQYIRANHFDTGTTARELGRTDADGQYGSESPGAKKAKRLAKRSRGMFYATTKLTKEETEVNELSKKTLGSYIKKAADSAAVNHADRIAAMHQNDSFRRAMNDVDHNNGQGSGKDRGKLSDIASAGSDIIRNRESKAFRKSANRIHGIGKAVTRLTKEDAMQEDTDTKFGKNEPTDTGLKKKNNPLYSNGTKIAKAGLSDTKGKGAAPSSVSKMDKFGKNKPKMDAIKDDSKWDKHYGESVEDGDAEVIDDEPITVTQAVVSQDAVALADIFDSRVRQVIDQAMFGDEEPEEEDEGEESEEA